MVPRSGESVPRVQEGLGFGAGRGEGAGLSPPAAAQLPSEMGGRAMSSVLSMKMARTPAARGRCSPWSLAAAHP